MLVLPIYPGAGVIDVVPRTVFQSGFHNGLFHLPPLRVSTRQTCRDLARGKLHCPHWQ
jgi:hypothetical protein